MASAASPTPMGHGSTFSTMGRRTSARQALRRPTSRSQLNRSGSTPVVPGVAHSHAREDHNAQSHQASAVHDSSDDEPVPMKLSALTKALLNDESSAADGPAKHAAADAAPVDAVPTRRRSALSRSTSSATGDKDADAPKIRQTRRNIRSGGPQISSSRPTSPVRSRETSPVARKRVVRLSNTAPAGGVPAGVLKTNLSLSASKHARRPPSRERAEEKVQPLSQLAAIEPQQPVINTPSGSVRRVQIVVGSSDRAKGRLSSSSAGLSSKRPGSAPQSDQEGIEDPATAPRHSGSASRLGASVRGKESEPGPQSSMRVKRVRKVPGSFLSGPARRGRRRHSEEDEENSPLDENGDGDALLAGQAPESQANDIDQIGSSFYQPYVPDFAASGSPVSAKDPARAAALRRHSPPEDRLPSPKGILVDRHVNPPPVKPVVLRPELPSAHDKENEDPYRVKSYPKPLIPDLDFVKPAIHRVDIDVPSSVMREASPERKALAPVNRNTPHRPAPPPPPKMSVLETATAPGGAAAAKKSRILLKVGGKAYSKLDCIGRGGSGKVYKVTAENGKIYALKRVPFEGADDSTVRGFRGEIDLLRKLSGVERVIQIIDHEINNEKKMLSVLMEMGELDFNSLLKARQGAENPKLDTVSVRFYWKEMLECLQAVHAHDIVHSDLKPANFVLVQGRLKLIDFGIANAIQTDQTVNVHRETQIGTPNYMSPESLMDSQQYAYISTNNGRLGMAHGRGGPKLMKLGKPSDVWSLGCILYQLVYGQPPFGLIQHQLARCQAIINWNHPIDYPERGIGGVMVPLSLIRTMKKCLNREQHQRPTCEQLLSESDPFMYPQENSIAGMDGSNLPINEDMMKRIIQSVVNRCRERMPTDGEVLSAWPAAYWASIRKAVTATNDGRA